MTSLPFPAVWLGLAGLVPLLLAAIGVLIGGPWWRAFSSSALLAYGAAVLSFLGAVHWGIAIAQPDAPGNRSRLTLGVLPALIATLALLLPRWLGLCVLVAGLLAVHVTEEGAARAGLVPGGYLWLRRFLTLGAVICVSAGLLGLMTGSRLE